VTCSTKIRLRKATTITGIYAALDLCQKTVRAVLKRQDGKIVNELKIKKQADIYTEKYEINKRTIKVLFVEWSIS
jgi:hypothetical protein